MVHRVWSAVGKAARWYVVSFGAALASLGNAELIYLQRTEGLQRTVAAEHLEAYARAGMAELEAWLQGFTVND